MAFASLDDPTTIVVEGRVAATQAWSTSKVLIVAAFLDTVADGEADKITDRNRELITSALTASNADAVNAIHPPETGRKQQRHAEQGCGLRPVFRQLPIASPTTARSVERCRWLAIALRG